jgi:trehalose 6-phosphate phosphatase
MFSETGNAALANRLGPATLVGLDFDGTLSPIVPRPEEAFMTQAMARSVAGLIDVCKVAILTGRPVDDVLRRIPVRPHYVLGNHGMEGLPGTQDLCEQAARLNGTWMNQLQAALKVGRLCSGVCIEDKTYSVALHYRLCQDRGLARRHLEECIAGLDPRPRVIGGHFVFNLLLPLAPDKSAFNALAALCGCDNAVFIGDDETDELVFRDAPPGWLTVRVGYAMDSAAHYFLQHQGEVRMLIDKITAMARRSAPGLQP